MIRLLRRWTAIAMLGGLTASAYIAVPLWTAWTIREAIRDNDSAYLEHKIEWPSVRVSLKESLQKFAFTAAGAMTAAPEKPGMWQRFKTYLGRGAVDQFVEATVTPAGLSSVFQMRKTYNQRLGSGESAVRPPLFERMKRVWARVTRAEFASFDRFEMDMIDKQAPERTINCVLELRGLEWKMTELRVKATNPQQAAAVSKFAAM